MFTRMQPSIIALITRVLALKYLYIVQKKTIKSTEHLIIVLHLLNKTGI